MRNPNPTYGEARLERLLAELPKQNYFYIAQPRLYSTNGKDHKPDFVVISREYGLLIIEVKDWVDLRGGSQDEIHIVRRDGTEVTQPNPVNIAEEYAYRIVQQCMKRQELTQRYRNRTRLAFPWQIMVVLPHIGRDRIKEFARVGIWSNRVVLGREILDSPRKFETAVRNLPWRWELPQQLDNGTVDVIRGVLNPTLVIRDAAGTDLGTQTVEQERLINEPLSIEPEIDEEGDTLSAEARHVVQDLQVRLVRGAAGSGKTLVLANRAEFLTRTYPDQRVLVITFNRDLSEALRDRMKTSGVKVQTYNEICHQVLQASNKWESPIEVSGWLEQYAQADIQATGLSLSYVRQEIRWRKEMKILTDEQYLNVQRKGRGQALNRDKRLIINKIFNNYLNYQATLRRQGQPWQDWDDLHTLARETIRSSWHALHGTQDVVLIDEAQDFAPSWFDVIRLLLRPGGSLFIADDPTQSIYQAYSWLEKGIEVRGRTRILRVPFRSTRAIMRAAFSLIEADALLAKSDDIIAPDLDSDELIQGETPELLAFHDLKDEITALEADIEAQIRDGMNPRAIAVLCHNRRSLRQWEALQKRHKDLFVAHFERMKGLDFDVVYIPHLHEMFKGITDPGAISEARRRLYVGMTRARDRLVLTHCERLPEALQALLPHVDQQA